LLVCIIIGMTIEQSFAIDKLSGKKCYMLGARELSITRGDSSEYWKWIPSAELPISAQSRSLSSLYHSVLFTIFLYVATMVGGNILGV
jgi:hypothetical protein